ncbi:type II toxin-antitoxin system VapC family toxin [Candidatus Woesearchaeota archaeon]|nr:type II toxin-antitoxin system VapC family toxin [Candidatus Woesearchaeota archaeon]
MEESIYLDANVFIFAAINEENIGKKAKAFLNSLLSRKTKIFTSTLTFDEFSYKVLKNRKREDALRVISAFFNIPYLTFLDVNSNMTWSAFELIKNYNLNPRDAIHAACAINNNIKIILSEDKDFDRVKELKRLSLGNVKW